MKFICFPITVFSSFKLFLTTIRTTRTIRWWWWRRRRWWRWWWSRWCWTLWLFRRRWRRFRIRLVNYGAKAKANFSALFVCQKSILIRIISSLKDLINYYGFITNESLGVIFRPNGNKIFVIFGKFRIIRELGLNPANGEWFRTRRNSNLDFAHEFFYGHETKFLGTIHSANNLD